jgi:hypothetical protein
MPFESFRTVLVAVPRTYTRARWRWSTNSISCSLKRRRKQDKHERVPRRRADRIGFLDALAKEQNLNNLWIDDIWLEDALALFDASSIF